MPIYRIFACDRQNEIVTHFAPGVEERKIGVRRLIDTEITAGP